MARLGVFMICLLLANPAFAMGPTERACLQSDRSPGRTVCACAQTVADQVLSAGDQREAARIILDPDRFYRYHGSKRQSRKAFLERYRAWGDAANQFCAQ